VGPHHRQGAESIPIEQTEILEEYGPDKVNENARELF